jgi:hypothetical protein
MTRSWGDRLVLRCRPHVQVQDEQGDEQTREHER